MYIYFIVSRNNFDFCYVIGKGGFGKVWKVRHKKTKKFYALKEMSKLKVLDKKSEKSINSEREFLSKLHNPFIVNMYYAFQDSENLYLVMDLMTGGDLRFHISRHKKFSEEQTRFFICGIIIALEYIHSNNVIHRDIKPENLVLDEKGYIRLTDFGIAKENMPDNRSETSGTPGYMSPEVMKALNHSFPVDFFALGVIGYEFMKGERPYLGRNRKEIKEQIIARQVEIKNDEISEGWSKESADFINKALIRKPENRIGYKGINELKIHPWLKYYPWEMLYNKSLPSPFIPENKDNFDRRYCESSDVITEETKLRYEEILMDDIYKTAFKSFYYNSDDEEFKKNNNLKSNNINNNQLKKKDNFINNNNTKSHKLIITQNDKSITDINKKMVSMNSNNKKKKNSNNKTVKNSMKIIPSARNIIIKNHQKLSSIINEDKNIENNNNMNSNNIGGNVSNNVIYINFNINQQPNMGEKIYCNRYQNRPSKTDRVLKQKSSAKSIYSGGNTINNITNINNSSSFIKKLGINMGNYLSPNNSVKRLLNNNNSGSKKLLKNIDKNSLKRSYKKNIINKKKNNNNLFNENSKKNITKNNKNIHNSMKEIFDLKNRTTVIDSPDIKNPKNAEILSMRENISSLNKSNNELKIKNREMTNSYSLKDSLISDFKKEHSLPKDNNSINKNNINNQKINNINRFTIKKTILKNQSPNNNHKSYIIINSINNSSSIPNIIKDKLNKNSRAYINSYNSNNFNISVNKSKTFLNEKKAIKEIREIKQIFKSNLIKNKEGINCYKNKSKNNNINMSKKSFHTNNYNINNTNNKMNRNSEITLPDSKNKNTSFDNLQEKDILIGSVSVNNNNNNNKIILNNKKCAQKKLSHNESTKLMIQKNKNNNKMYFFSPNETKSKINKNLKNNQSKFQTNNLSISSIIIRNNKKKEISNSSLNINNFLNKENEYTRGYISVRNNDNNNRKSLIDKGQKQNNKNIIFSYKQKQKLKMNNN